MNTEIRDFVLPSAPAKTLWFEFLFVEGLLEQHLSDPNCDPSPIDLVIQFINHANKDSQEDKKAFMLKLLAAKVMSFFEFDLDFMEKNLPLAMQFTILVFLKKITNESLISQVLYYRWFLRSLSRALYPSRSPKGLVMPPSMLQQIDPAFTATEVTQGLMDMLFKETEDTIEQIEKMLREKTISQDKSVKLPRMSCFSIKKIDGSFFLWKDVSKVDECLLENQLRFDLGKYYFIRHPPDFKLSFSHLHDIASQEKYRGYFEHLDDFVRPAFGMTQTVPKEEKTDTTQEAKKCLESMFRGDDGLSSSFDFSTLTAQQAKDLLSQYKDGKTYRIVSLLLCSKIQGLRDILDLKTSSVEEEEKEQSDSMKDDLEEEGEIIEEDMEDESLETQLINSTCKEAIIDLSTRVLKPPQEINIRWKLPQILLKAIQSSNADANLKFAVMTMLCKAMELRNHGMYSESRELFLAVMESYSTRIDSMNHLIPYEILMTQVQEILQTSDADEVLLKKCADFIPFDKMLLQFDPKFPLLLCKLLLKHRHPVLINDFTGLDSVIPLTSAIYRVSHGDTSVKTVKDLWDSLLDMLLKCCTDRLRRPQQSSPQECQEILIDFLTSLPSSSLMTLCLSCLIRIYNLSRDNSVNELSMPVIAYAVEWPSSCHTLPLSVLSSILHPFLQHCIREEPMDVTFLRTEAELLLIEGVYESSFKAFLEVLSILSKCFTDFSQDMDKTIERMIFLANKTCCHTESAVLQSMLLKPNYALAFKSLSEKSCRDSCHDLIPCISDMTLLEFLVNLNDKRGDHESQALQLISQLEVNSNNPRDIRIKAANQRKSTFFHILMKKYM